MMRALAHWPINRVRNLHDVFREFCVYKVILSPTCASQKNATCAQNAPNMFMDGPELTY